MSSIKTVLIRKMNNSAIARKVIRHLVWFIYDVIYLFVKAFIVKNRIEEKTYLFEVFQGRKFACSPRAIYEEMLRNPLYKDFHYIWVFRDCEKYQFLEKNSNTTLVKLGSLEYFSSVAKSKFWIVNSRTKHFLKPGKKQYYIQTWHGTPLKRLGCDIMVEGNNVMSSKEMKADYRQDAKRISYFLSPSDFYREKIISAFDLKRYGKENSFIQKGYPRNDDLFRVTKERVDEIKTRLNLPLNKKVILYAPTFRDNQHMDSGGCGFTLGFDLNRMQKELEEEYVVLFRTHYFVTSQIDLEQYSGFVYNVSELDDINELYMVSDLLITDYSSVFFDYANLRRPILFYMYDLEEYQSQIRDFYIKIEELPGPVLTKESDLYEEIHNLDKHIIYNEVYENFSRKFNPLDGPDCSRQVLQELGKLK